ncbi:hypothetical protein GYMLUDRAFT_61795 [Collybiopsis luxurians FD-317 M1]|uniref:Uncharacterized protein n=1 Tax=Collybiopsis luxurians FD-317 M1 TaxID=944289 RepID=A0A0D0CF84_9AGAR|nr:hypothetical protein GYMLUDRAFT_61795 [Collybiopsis luxurians FD-317 M1]
MPRQSSTRGHFTILLSAHRGPRINPPRCSQPRPNTHRNAFEAALLNTPSSLKLPDIFFPTDREIDEKNLMAGIEPDQLEAHREHYHKRWDKLFARAGQDTLEIWGLKPRQGDTIHLIPIPSSNYAIRFWNGGLEHEGECCLDFIDRFSNKATNSPERWQLVSASRAGAVFQSGGVTLLSREEAAGYQRKSIPPGEERFDVNRASCYILRCPGHPDFIFDVPSIPTPGAAQARECETVV